ncbi:MAG: amidohydrolase [Rubrobacter sp.]|jgi:predicted amidohydrolase|nr:amidohydrolase [Rubrobacter sp.]
MRIALAQVDPILGDVSANIEKAAEAVREAKSLGSDLVVFPELSLTGYSLGQVSDEVSLDINNDERIKELLAEAGDTSLLLCFHEDDGGVRTYNSAAYFEDGHLLHLHRKLYLPTYGHFEERKHFAPGQRMRAFTTKHGRMAALICNDAWQPTLGFLAVQDSARVLLVPTNSADSRFPGDMDTTEYWHDITSFYGRMYECYVVFVNRVGTEGDLAFWGNSHVADPMGNLMAEAPLYKETLITADLDLGSVLQRRRRVPLLREARLGLLSREMNRLSDEGGDL